MKEQRNAYKILVGEPERKRQLGRSWRRCEDIIRIYHVETWGGKMWAGSM
jgi:hypothetical protein